MSKQPQSASEIPIPMYGLMGAILAIVAVIMYYTVFRASRPVDVRTDQERLLALAGSHPNQVIRKDLLEAVEEGEVDLVTGRIDGNANGTFSVPYGRPTITIDTTLLTASASVAGREIAFATLSHEERHYQQWLTRAAVRDLHAAYQTDAGLTSAQCVLKVMNEVEAHAETCNEARLYRWQAAIQTQCGNISASKRARRFLEKVHDLTECRTVWQTLSASDIPIPKPPPEDPADPPDEDASGGAP